MAITQGDHHQQIFFLLQLAKPQIEFAAFCSLKQSFGVQYFPIWNNSLDSVVDKVLAVLGEIPISL